MRNIFMTAIAAVLLSFAIPAQSAELSQVKMCVGSETGNYHRIGKFVMEWAVKASKVRKKYPNLQLEMVNTAGSQEILDMVNSGECDFGIAQYDAFVYLKDEGDISGDTKKLGDLYPEYVHLLCGRKSGIDDANDIDSKDETIALVPGSGAELTWKAMALVDDDYGKVRVMSVDDVDEAVINVSDGEAHCTLYVSGLGSASLKDIDANDGESIKLVDFDDSDFNDAQTKKGKDMYSFTEIDSSIYRNLLGWSDVDTIVVQASMYTNRDFYKKHKVLVTTVRKTMNRKRKEILQATGN